jgi:hypothetical protein
VLPEKANSKEKHAPCNTNSRARVLTTLRCLSSHHTHMLAGISRQAIREITYSALPWAEGRNFCDCTPMPQKVRPGEEGGRGVRVETRG